MIRKLINSHFFNTYPTLFFWACFLALNGVLFLPLFLLDGGDNTLLPAAQDTEGAWSLFGHLTLWRTNLDPLRVNVEFALLVALWVAVPWLQRSAYRAIVYIFYAIALVYALYEAVVLSIWLIDPIFYSQWFLARDGLPFLLRHLNVSSWMILATATAIAAGVWAIGALLRIMMAGGAAPRLAWGTRGILIVIACFGIFAGVRYQGYTARPEMVQSSTTAKLATNIRDSIALHATVAAFDDKPLRAAYNFDALALQQHPDLFIIYIESYGSVLYKRDDWKAAYGDLADELTQTLSESGWLSASGFSTSPTWGGGSWLAYTSGLMGTMIDNQPQYLDLRKRYDADPYPNLGRALQEKDYWFVWLSALDDNYNDAAWASLERFYGTNQMIRYEDLEYEGDGFGWGDSPPDQFTLHKAIKILRAQQSGEASAAATNIAGERVAGEGIAQEGIAAASDGTAGVTIAAGSTITDATTPATQSTAYPEAVDRPILLHTITQNSHYPFAPLPPLVEDWRTLIDQPADAAARDAALAAEPPARRANYLASIDYQLRMLVNFIQTEGNDNSLFILIGDHQPPTVSRRADGFETPVHIVSRNPAVMEAFAEKGFTPGLRIASGSAAIMDHAGFYGLVMHTLTGTVPPLQGPLLQIPEVPVGLVVPSGN